MSLLLLRLNRPRKKTLIFAGPTLDDIRHWLQRKQRRVRRGRTWIEDEDHPATLQLTRGPKPRQPQLGFDK